MDHSVISILSVLLFYIGLQLPARREIYKQTEFPHKFVFLYLLLTRKHDNSKGQAMNIHRPLYKTNNRHVEKPPQVALGKWHILDMTSRNFIIPVSNNVINLASQIHRKEHIEIFQTMKLKKKGNIPHRRRPKHREK